MREGPACIPCTLRFMSCTLHAKFLLGFTQVTGILFWRVLQEEPAVGWSAQACFAFRCKLKGPQPSYVPPPTDHLLARRAMQASQACSSVAVTLLAVTAILGDFAQLTNFLSGSRCRVK